MPVTHGQQSVDPISAGPPRHEQFPGLGLHGFADVGGAWSSDGDPTRQRGFGIGSLDLYLTPQFGNRIKSLIEIVFEFEYDGRPVVDMERLQLGYAWSDELTLWAGRFHTPLGLWSTLFHHGANLQRSIFRPRFVDFEDLGGILPTHSVGLWALGKARFGAGRVTYDGYLANGPSIRERRLDPNAFTDDDSGKMLGFNLGYQPGGEVDGLTVGVHGFASTISSYSGSNALIARTRLRTAGVYFGYDTEQWDAIGEYYHFADTDTDTDTASGARHSSNAWFVHVGRTLGQWTPFLRFERMSLDPNDNYFRSQRFGRSYRRSAVGMHYLLDPRASLKFELNRTRERAIVQIDESGALVPFAAARYRRAAVQYSIEF